MNQYWTDHSFKGKFKSHDGNVVTLDFCVTKDKARYALQRYEHHNLLIDWLIFLRHFLQQEFLEDEAYVSTM